SQLVIHLPASSEAAFFCASIILLTVSSTQPPLVLGLVFGLSCQQGNSFWQLILNTPFYHFHYYLMEIVNLRLFYRLQKSNLSKMFKKYTYCLMFINFYVL